MQLTESTQQKIAKLRALNESEKLALIFTQQRKMGEFQGRLEAFQCAHQTGVCPLCRDKDLTIAQLQQQVERLKDKIYGRSSERRRKNRKDRKKKTMTQEKSQDPLSVPAFSANNSQMLAFRSVY